MSLHVAMSSERSWSGSMENIIYTDIFEVRELLWLLVCFSDQVYRVCAIIIFFKIPNTAALIIVLFLYYLTYICYIYFHILIIRERIKIIRRNNFMEVFDFVHKLLFTSWVVFIGDYFIASLTYAFFLLFSKLSCWHRH